MIRKALIIFVLALASLSLSPAAEGLTEKSKPREYIDCYFGSGHGGTLTLLKFIRYVDDTYAVLRVQFDGGGYIKLTPRSAWEGDAYNLATETAAITSDRYHKVKAACLTALSESSPTSKNQTRMAMTTVDFLAGIKTFNDDMFTEKIYCGYMKSNRESFYKPLNDACATVREEIKELEWKKSEGRDICEFVTSVLTAQSPKFKDDISWWWPKERLIRMTGIKGNTQAIPMLILLTTSIKAKAYSDNNSVNDRNLGYIVTALDVITGKGLRFDKEGNPRELDVVVNDYLQLYGQGQEK